MFAIGAAVLSFVVSRVSLFSLFSPTRRQPTAGLVKTVKFYRRRPLY
jgi:hypothetical protein